MKVAIVIDSLVGGGAEKVMLTLAGELLAQQHEVVILSLANSIEYTLPSQLHVECLFDHKAKKVDRFWQLKKSVQHIENWFAQYQSKNGEFDLVLSNLDRSNNLLICSSIKHVFYVIHNSITAELNRQKKLGPFAYHYLLKSKKRLSGQNLICVSEGIESEIKQQKLISPRSITTIFNPFNIQSIVKKASEAELGLPSEPYIIHVGRLAKQKRHDVLFSAFANLNTSHKLVLLCNKVNKAAKLGRQHGIEDRLILPGFQQNPYAWIKGADALVLSSDYEGLPTVLIEALILGTPVVSTDCTHGPKEILTGSLAKYLVPTNNPGALTQAIESVLNDKPEVVDAEILSKIPSTKVAESYLALAQNR